MELGSIARTCCRRLAGRSIGIGWFCRQDAGSTL